MSATLPREIIEPIPYALALQEFQRRGGVIHIDGHWTADEAKIEAIFNALGWPIVKDTPVVAPVNEIPILLVIDPSQGSVIDQLMVYTESELVDFATARGLDIEGLPTKAALAVGLAKDLGYEAEVTHVEPEKTEEASPVAAVAVEDAPMSDKAEDAPEGPAGQTETTSEVAPTGAKKGK